MTTSLRFEDARLQRMEQATLWLQRMRTDAPDDVLEDWLDWCQRDPLNQQAFDEIAAVWEMSGQLATRPRAAATRPGTSRRLALAASLAGLGLATVLGVWWSDRPAAIEVLATEFASPIGVNSVQTLEDGSRLELGGGTRVSVTMGSGARRVQLHEGELFVTVHHDTSRPFSVDAGGLDVIATGTAFNVLRSPGRTTVTVAEGSVNALYQAQADTASNVHLQSGQQLAYSHASHTVLVRQVNLRNATAWRNGMLHFEGEPLGEVVATMNRYAAKQIVIEDPRIRALSFNGTARTDRIQGWLAALPQVFPVAVVALDDGRQLIRPRQVRAD